MIHKKSNNFVVRERIINQGFQLKDLFKLVKSVETKAAKGDPKSKSILKGATDRWGISSGYIS